MPASTERRPPLTRKQAQEVLRYWLAAVQQEEALLSRPKARSPSRGSAVPRLDLPGSGQDYFKLQLGLASQLFEANAVLHKAFDAELSAFFESWLHSQYRRGDQERAVSHLLTFPVVHLPRGELAGLLRCPVELAFGQPSAASFEVPARGQRRHNNFPPPPSEVRLALVEVPEQRLPFFVDTRLMQQQLGIVREHIDAMFEKLRAQQPDHQRMLQTVCALLEAELAERAGSTQDHTDTSRSTRPAGDPTQGSEQAGPLRTEAVVTAATTEPQQLIARIHMACVRLMASQGGRARAYPVALVLDSTRSKATFYLQRDLQSLLEEEDTQPWALDSCLGAYLRGEAPALGMAAQRGLFPGPSLSASQRYAAESCEGSRFTAVQGPPGTGKTTLILHLAAAALVKQVQTLASTGDMSDGLMLVTSTNNRAVDNVIEGLARHGQGELPLSLRVGSQQVCEHVLLPVLERVSARLEQARAEPAAAREQRLQAALAQFQQLHGCLKDAQAPRERACEARTQRAQLQEQLTRVRRELSSAPAPRVRTAHASGLRQVLERGEQRLTKLAALTEVKPSLQALQAVDREHRKLSKSLLPQLQAALSALTDVGAKQELSLPPALPPSSDPGVLMQSWAEAVDHALSVVVDLRGELETQVALEIRRERERVLADKLDRLGSAPVELPAYDPAHDELQRSVFDAAVRVREAWACAQADDLLRAVFQAIAAVRAERSLRRLWRDGAPAYKRLRQLFGLWGCTLLSVGNCVPSEPGAIELLVIDEAGQCHPAYAVSGLMRAQRSLIIGDVHQLEPVIEIEPDDDERVIQACRLQMSRAVLEPYRVHSEAQTSVQSLADRAVSERPSLTEHFRCQPEIIQICDDLCRYELRVLTPPEGPSVPLPFLVQPVSLVDVCGSQERAGGSWYNRAEVEHALELLTALIHHGVPPGDIAVITPYRGQLEQLRKRAGHAGFPIDRSLELLDIEEALPTHTHGIALGTVHRFQGGERSVVLFSSVVTRAGSLVFVDGRANLLNVAVSRARHRLIVVGHAALLAQGQRTRLLTSAASPLSPDAYRTQLGLW